MRGAPQRRRWLPCWGLGAPPCPRRNLPCGEHGPPAQCPRYRDADIDLTQSHAILRYLARKHNL